MRVILNHLTVETLGRVHGSAEFIRALDVALPEAHLHAADHLRTLAEEQGWDPPEYFSEQAVLDEQYRSWVPRYARYAAVVLLHSTVETQLFACADHVQLRLARCPIKERKRRSLHRARRCLQDVSGIDVAGDSVWGDLLLLEELRHVIVHRGEPFQTQNRTGS